MKKLIFSGDNYNIGLQHGESLREDIKKTLEIYLQLWQIPIVDLSGRVFGFKDSIITYFPHLSEEINGIARGANLDVDMIYALNSRTELLPNSPLECTAIAIAEHLTKNNELLIGQNWDWVNVMFGLTKVVEIKQNNKPDILQFIEPGMIGKIGLNDSGLGVCFNFLETKRDNKLGLPVHVLLRAILESGSITEAMNLFNIQRASSANYLLAQEKRIIDLEATPNTLQKLDYPSTNLIVHTNSYSLNGETCLRKSVAESFISGKNNLSIEDIKEMLSLPGVFMPARYGSDISTVNTIIMNLTKKEMHIYNGSEESVYLLNKF